MKMIFLFLNLLFVLGANASDFRSPDILVDTRLDYDWSRVLITKLRLLLKNYKMDDPFVGNFPGKLLVKEANVGQLLPSSSKNLISSLGDAIGLSLLQSETKVFLEDFSYDVKGFKTDLKDSVSYKDGLLVDTHFSASEVNLKAKRLSLSLFIPGQTGSPILNIGIINPMVVASEDNLITFFAKLKIQDENDVFRIMIKNANFDQMANGLISNADKIILKYERLDIPKVSLKIGNKTVNFDPEKIQRVISSNHEAIKGILLAQAGDLLRTNTAETAFRVLEQYKINKEYWIASEMLLGQIKIGKINSANDGANIEVSMPGDFCTTKKYDQHQKLCVNRKVTQVAPTRLDLSSHKKSVQVMHELVNNGNADIVASISEDYLNKLLVTTYDAGLWKDALDEAGVGLGPNKVIMRLDKKGDSGTLIMDVIYRPTSFEKILTGSKEIRFPLVLDVSVRIENHQQEPVVIIRLNDVDTTDQTLIYGRPAEEYLFYVPRTLLN
jgi:hypothetical protein